MVVSFPRMLWLPISVALHVAAGATACAEPSRNAVDALLPSAAEADFRYATDYPAIGYSELRPRERIAALQDRLEAGAVTLGFDARNGYLEALLEAAEIDPASQVLVFSKTSLNKPWITPRTPRAIYFNDDTYVARVPGAGVIEIASMDPVLGPVFFVLEDRETTRPVFDRQTVQCLRCHDSLTLTGGGVPRFILGSGYIDTRGNLVSHEGWILTDQATPLRFRWGGWYVTGRHGAQPHLGNIIVRDVATLRQLDDLRVYNREMLAGHIEVGNYPRATSDIVALLVLEHQVHVQNVITRVNYDTRTALAAGPTVSEETKSSIEAAAETLVQALLFAGEPELTEPVAGSADFSAGFERRGPFDGKGQTLREFDLETRLFKYPLSYLVYSPAFDALPEPVRAYVYARLAELFTATEPEPVVARLADGERQTLLALLRATKPEFTQAIAASGE